MQIETIKWDKEKALYEQKLRVFQERMDNLIQSEKQHKIRQLNLNQMLSNIDVGAGAHHKVKSMFNQNNLRNSFSRIDKENSAPINSNIPKTAKALYTVLDAKKDRMFSTYTTPNAKHSPERPSICKTSSRSLKGVLSDSVYNLKLPFQSTKKSKESTSKARGSQPSITIKQPLMFNHMSRSKDNIVATFRPNSVDGDLRSPCFRPNKIKECHRFITDVDQEDQDEIVTFDHSGDKRKDKYSTNRLLTLNSIPEHPKEELMRSRAVLSDSLKGLKIRLDRRMNSLGNTDTSELFKPSRKKSIGTSTNVDRASINDNDDILERLVKAVNEKKGNISEVTISRNNGKLGIRVALNSSFLKNRASGPYFKNKTIKRKQQNRWRMQDFSEIKQIQKTLLTTVKILDKKINKLMTI